MKIDWIPTDSIYRRLIAETDPAARRQFYLDQIVEPWRQMMNMMGGSPFGVPEDELSGARAWGWLLPDQVAEIAALLEELDSADAWSIAHGALRLAATRFAPWDQHIPFDRIEGWLVLVDPSRSNSLERGYTGATDWFQPRLIGQVSEANEYVLSRLPGLVAHELHHLVRLRLFPWDMQRTTVADYVILEGMAEAFAASLFGEDKVGYYISEFNPAEMAAAMRLVGDGLEKTGFDLIRSYIFGDALAERSGFAPLGGMPAYGGYTIGYHVVRAFLERTGRNIEEATFLPANEIVQGSGFFTRVI